MYILHYDYQDTPIALYNGSPVVESHANVVSLWFVIPIVIISFIFNPSTSNFRTTSLMHVFTAKRISLGSCSIHPSCGLICSMSIWWDATSAMCFALNTCNAILLYFHFMFLLFPKGIDSISKPLMLTTLYTRAMYTFIAWIITVVTIQIKKVIV